MSAHGRTQLPNEVRFRVARFCVASADQHSKISARAPRCGNAATLPTHQVVCSEKPGAALSLGSSVALQMDRSVGEDRHIPNTTLLRYPDGSIYLGPMISNRSLHRVVRESIVSILCTAPVMKHVGGPGPFGFGNQLGAGLGGIAGLVHQGHRVNMTGFRFLESNVVLPGHTPHGAMINAASNCTAPDWACMFMDVNKQCFTWRRHYGAASTALLSPRELAHLPQFVYYGELARIALKPSSRLLDHVQKVLQAVGRPHITIHVRRGDRLTVTNGHDFIRAYPTSSLAMILGNASSTLPAVARVRLLVLSDDADVPDDLAYLLPRMDVHTVAYGDTLGEELGEPANKWVDRWKSTWRERPYAATADGRCGMPANHGTPPLPRCRPPDAIGLKAHVHRFGLHEMGPADFLFAAASAVAQGCIIIASTRSGYSMLMWTLAQGAGQCKGTPQIVDLDGELTLHRLSSGYWGCGNRMMCSNIKGLRAVHVCKAAAHLCRGRPYPMVY